LEKQIGQRQIEADPRSRPSNITIDASNLWFLRMGCHAGIQCKTSGNASEKDGNMVICSGDPWRDVMVGVLDDKEEPG
jgi:hypothetical protein